MMSIRPILAALFPSLFAASPAAAEPPKLEQTNPADEARREAVAAWLSPEEFARRFAALKEELDDPDARFWGEGMRDELLELVPSIPDKASEAWLFRELAVVEGKRGELSCLDHADRALAAQEAGGALPPDRLYFMHVLCGDIGMAWSGGPRTEMHLDRALALHGELGRPIGEALQIRMNRGIHERTMGRARMGLDWFEPLLADSEKEYGPDGSELSNLLRLMSESEEQLGNMADALAYLERSVALGDYRADQGRRVSGLIGLAELRFRAGKTEEAKATFDEAIAHAEKHSTPTTLKFARDEKAKVFP